jgi:predicted ATPase
MPMRGGVARQGSGFGDILRRYRVAAGLTQEALAERAAMSARGISDLERGVRTHPYPATVRRLAEALALSDAHRTVLERAATRIGAEPSGPVGALPTPLSSFVGREQQVAVVRKVLAVERLVTLLGPGGIGKTRLAIEAAAGAGGAFADGVVFVALANVRDPGLVVGAVAEALGIQEMGSRPLTDRVRSRLRTAHTLVLLDNFEHVLPAADAVGALLADCPRLHLLVTSRVPLRLAGERELPVPPLALPDVHRMPPPEQLSSYEAVRLFLERAQAAPAAEDAAAIAEICIRLERAPARPRARRVAPAGALPPDAPGTPGPALPLLVGGPRDMPARQRTLTATITWSHDLLDAAEQRLFRRIAVFVGGFTLDAAEAVCGDAELGPAVLDGIESLLEKSLVGRHGGARLRLLETVREYAVERASAAGELAELRRRHAAYYLGVAEAAEFASVDAPSWLQRLEVEHNNLRAALRWALEHEPSTALRLGSAIWRFLVRAWSPDRRRSLAGGGVADDGGARWRLSSSARRR